MDALRQLDHWPVGTAAAAVLRHDGGHDGEKASQVSQVGLSGDPEVPFRLASVSKTMSAYALLVAVEEGALALDDPAGPEGSTVAHLLAHVSGLAFASSRVLARPGTRRIYSNAGFDELGRHLEQVTDIPFATYLAEAVFVPLGMKAAALAGSPAFGVLATLADVTAFAAELLAPTLVSAATFERATSVAFPGLHGILPGFGAQNPNDWGLGFEIRGHKSPHWTAPANSPRTFGHFGRSGTFLWVDPEASVACVALTDRDFGEWAAAAWPVLSAGVLAELGVRADSGA
ncbi:penicillin-binding protein [Parafrankia colletiae]|uniref:Penicillin-binding protein n=1 Tax=Parafrankia colletiae TaxID=573497 RepID=A0A1S1QW25_9ACTN|nr:serine hydrolase domain-containing protein [Parafrankia colletiae]MCK9900655.1 beta-lactamase family protein [Frankia sp. Cpl3]OHV38918.1 penicillin-binding protein [Parafrankia colletiae]